MERVEELEQQLAQVVVWIRGNAVCPEHPWVAIPLPSDSGGASVPPRVWNGPVCELPAKEQLDRLGSIFADECEWRQTRDETLASIYETLGTADMSRWV